MSFLAPVVGGLLGGLFGGSDGGGQQVSKDPWAPAQPWLLDNLKTGQNLQNYYQQNPFNSIQQTSYQNLLGDIDNYRQNVNPGLMAFANKLMSTNYSRNGGNQGDSIGAQSSQGGLLGGLMGPQTAQGANMNGAGGAALRGGLLGDGAVMASGSGLPLGPFSAPTGGMYGAINWQELNPFTATDGIRADTKPAEEEKPKTPEELADEERRRRIQSGEGYRGEGA